MIRRALHPPELDGAPLGGINAMWHSNSWKFGFLFRKECCIVYQLLLIFSPFYWFVYLPNWFSNYVFLCRIHVKRGITRLFEERRRQRKSDLWQSHIHLRAGMDFFIFDEFDNLVKLCDVSIRVKSSWFLLFSQRICTKQFKWNQSSPVRSSINWGDF